MGKEETHTLDNGEEAAVAAAGSAVGSARAIAADEESNEGTLE